MHAYPEAVYCYGKVLIKTNHPARRRGDRDPVAEWLCGSPARLHMPVRIRPGSHQPPAREAFSSKTLVRKKCESNVMVTLLKSE